MALAPQGVARSAFEDPLPCLQAWALGLCRSGQTWLRCTVREAAGTDQTYVSGSNLSSVGAGGNGWVNSRKGLGPYLPCQEAGGGDGWLCVSIWFRSDVRSQGGVTEGEVPDG